MSDLADFLLARIAEDELLARDAADDEPGPRPHWHIEMNTHDIGADIVNEDGIFIARFPTDVVVPGDNAEHIARWDPARVLAECEAKRRIVAEHRTIRGEKWACRTCFRALEFAGPWPCPTLRLLALPYADNPDYRQEWMP